MSKYYDNIEDFPLWNWRKCHKDLLEYTRQNIDDGTKNEDVQAWKNIRQSYLDEFGLTPDFEHLLNLTEELALLQCDYVINDDRFLLNKIRRVEAEILAIIGRTPENDTDSILIHLSKWMGQMLNDKIITVKMFHKMLKEYGKADQKK